jgi:hypothetical protein
MVRGLVYFFCETQKSKSQKFILDFLELVKRESFFPALRYSSRSPIRANTLLCPYSCKIFRRDTVSQKTRIEHMCSSSRNLHCSTIALPSQITGQSPDPTYTRNFFSHWFFVRKMWRVATERSTATYLFHSCVLEFASYRW